MKQQSNQQEYSTAQDLYDAVLKKYATAKRYSDQGERTSGKEGLLQLQRVIAKFRTRFERNGEFFFEYQSLKNGATSAEFGTPPRRVQLSRYEIIGNSESVTTTSYGPDGKPRAEKHSAESGFFGLTGVTQGTSCAVVRLLFGKPQELRSVSWLSAEENPDSSIGGIRCVYSNKVESELFVDLKTLAIVKHVSGSTTLTFEPKIE